ncbi:nitrate reductase molybdenum cofactor assembly chaperone [Caldimonas caldifontis]|uniref:Nitrate reductase molybdenum cofactor assembly chaperone n=1 Tax=Caldimonas caldifontis TaxID=1452508 RepID=A0A2S5SRC6_9BURK|nr:nitrate reductase molybdenum cofactor assembly chaperone [Caldimonas caldifontis]PPE65292.1 nitrate reductase molybdenum cofactor assembly chaperone [Caldimonas caldifontis]
MKRFPSRSCRAVACLLGYPDDALRAALDEIEAVVVEESALSKDARAGLQALIRQLRRGESFEVEARYVDTFDRGRATSLHLFEHVHGDSRDRGPAMVDLLQTYEQAGLYLAPGELPDYLPVALEFAATQEAAVARDFLGEMAHILNALHTALVQRQSPYAAAIAAVLEMAGERVQHVALPPEEGLDDAWAEPPAFDGCATKGQNRPEHPQPIHIVRKPAPSQGARA